MEFATQALVAELRRASIPYQRIDTADPHDELGNRGRWTVHNAQLAFRHLLQAIRHSFRPDICGVYVPIAQEFPALVRDMSFILIARLARKPVVIHLHGGAFAEFYWSRRKPIRYLLDRTIGRAALGIVLTETLRPALECVLAAERVVVVPNGLDLPTAGDEASTRRKPEHIEILYLSSLLPSKGIFVFLAAFAEARRCRPGLRATIAGSWPSARIRRDVLGSVDRLNIRDSVAFLGTVTGDQKTRLFANADVFCFPSTYRLEGQPLVLVEAMAAGLPVVATAYGGIPDTVVDGETGLLVPDASPDVISEKLVWLADHPEERERLGSAGRARYERFYTQHAFGERMINVLGMFIDGREAAGPAPTSGGMA